MTILFVILIINASGILGIVVLIQNPKGGRLSGSFGGFSNQLMVVKQTTDVLEKGTWVFAAVVGALCLFSFIFVPTGSASTSQPNKADDVTVPASSQPATTTPGQLSPNTVPLDTNK